MLGGFNLISSILTFDIGQSVRFINNSANQSLYQNYSINESFFAERPRDDIFRDARMNLLVSSSAITFINGILFIFSGLVIYFLIRKKEKKMLKQSLMDSMLQPSELLIINYLEKNDGQATQNELVKELGLSKVIVSRGIKSLESKKLIEKNKYGMTNKICLK
jgi:uncharacterized membrane protein